MSARWLLVLGSDTGGEAPIDAAMAALQELGQMDALTPARRFQDDDGTGRVFTNRLVRLESSAARDALRASLHEVERRIGRSEDSERVLIDIDLLACDAGGGNWQLDPHALEKGEHRRPHVRALLAEASISL